MAIKPSLELLHSNLAIAVTYALDLQHTAVEIMCAAEEKKESNVKVLVELGHMELVSQLATAYLALWFETVEGKALNTDHLLDYWEDVLTTSNLGEARLAFIKLNYDTMMDAHRSAQHGTTRKTR